MTSRVLDWRSRHDPRSLNYPVRALLGDAVSRRSRDWRASHLRLDQLNEGKCVGYGWTAELMAHPGKVKIGNGSRDEAEQFATELYRAAQRIDDWPGENYEGTSVLAGAQIVHAARLIESYRWAFTIDDVIDTLCASARDGGGPVVIGIPWYEGMYETRPGGLVEVSGPMVGGHCLTLVGYSPKRRIWEEGWWNRFEVIRWRNSWGTAYGDHGDGYIRPENLEWLLSQQGEACVPQQRATLRIDSPVLAV